MLAAPCLLSGRGLSHTSLDLVSTPFVNLSIPHSFYTETSQTPLVYPGVGSQQLHFSPSFKALGKSRTFLDHRGEKKKSRLPAWKPYCVCLQSPNAEDYWPAFNLGGLGERELFLFICGPILGFLAENKLDFEKCHENC